MLRYQEAMKFYDDTLSPLAVGIVRIVQLMFRTGSYGIGPGWLTARQNGNTTRIMTDQATVAFRMRWDLKSITMHEVETMFFSEPRMNGSHYYNRYERMRTPHIDDGLDDLSLEEIYLIVRFIR